MFDKITYDVHHRNSSQVQTPFSSSLAHCFKGHHYHNIHKTCTYIYTIYNNILHIIWFTDINLLHTQSSYPNWHKCFVSEVSPDRSTLKIQGREGEKRSWQKATGREMIWLYYIVEMTWYLKWCTCICSCTSCIIVLDLFLWFFVCCLQYIGSKVLAMLYSVHCWCLFVLVVQPLACSICSNEWSLRSLVKGTWKTLLFHALFSKRS